MMIEQEDEKKVAFDANDAIIILLGLACAEGGNRTHKGVSPHDFESCASASSATSALDDKYKVIKV